MNIYFRKPSLRSLSCGSRIAYARQFRGLSQQRLGEAIGLKKDKIRNRICRYERGGRVPKKDRILVIANVLNVSEGMIRDYDFRNPSDFIYEALWLEELMPELELTLHKGNPRIYETCDLFSDFYKEWRKKKKQLDLGSITKKDYIEWKLTYVVPGERRSDNGGE